MRRWMFREININFLLLYRMLIVLYLSNRVEEGFVYFQKNKVDKLE